MKYYIIAGEPSGDLHASNLMKHLKRFDVNAEFRAWGGDKMEEQGAEIVHHYRDMSFMGFWEVFMNLRSILGLIKECKRDIDQWQPDVVICIDYPGFNLRISEYAKKQGIKTFYYISPQVWAWKKNRVHKIKRFVDHMFVILPFEEEFYGRYNYPVDYVGHPLLDALEKYEFKSDEAFRAEYHLNAQPIIALLPGSRTSEVSRILPKMISALREFPEYQFVIAGMSGFEEDYYRKYASGVDVQIIFSDTYNLLHHAHAAVVASGTATLETAILNTPQVVCYETSTTTYYVAKFLVEIEYISLVNLIRGEEVIREIIQSEFNPQTLKRALEDILDGEKRTTLLKKYEELRRQLGGGGASEKAAKLMYEYATGE